MLVMVVTLAEVLVMKVENDEKLLRVALQKRRDYYLKKIEAIDLLLEDEFKTPQTSLSQDSERSKPEMEKPKGKYDDMTLSGAALEVIKEQAPEKMKPVQVAIVLEENNYTGSTSLRKSLRTTLLHLAKAKKVKREENSNPKERGYVYWFEKNDTDLFRKN